MARIQARSFLGEQKSALYYMSRTSYRIAYDFLLITYYLSLITYHSSLAAGAQLPPRADLAQHAHGQVLGLRVEG